jgi:hypothetical protein
LRDETLEQAHFDKLRDQLNAHFDKLRGRLNVLFDKLSGRLNVKQLNIEREAVEH